MNASQRDDASRQPQRFAWNGISFLTPANWNLSAYKFSRSLTRVEFEDDYSLRLEIEWTRPKRQLDIHKIQQRYEQAARKLTRAATSSTQLKQVPPGWAVFLYNAPGSWRLLTAFVISTEPRLFGFVKIHCPPQTSEDPADVINLIAESFRIHCDTMTPWACYDMSFDLPREFSLLSTSFEAGRKLMVFHWRLRKLYIWQFSLANILLKDCTPEQWSAEFLNSHKQIKGPTFSAGTDGRIQSKRSRRYLLGHFDEIGRLCFRYDAHCCHDEDNNRLILRVFNYSKAPDLAMLPKDCILAQS